MCLYRFQCVFVTMGEVFPPSLPPACLPWREREREREGERRGMRNAVALLL